MSRVATHPPTVVLVLVSLRVGVAGAIVEEHLP